MNEKLRLKAKAGKLGIPNFRSMSLVELKTSIAKAENGSGSKDAAKKVRPKLHVIEGGKSKTAPKKSGKKSVVAKTTANKKVSSPDKKGTAALKTKSSPAKKSKSQKTAPKKATAAKGTAKRRASGSVTERHYEGGKVGKGGYTNVDRQGIDWNRESNVGREGKRADVLAKLREHNGDYAAAFVDLRKMAPKWYPDAIKAYPKSPTPLAASERQLRWLIARVAYDYAYKTGQHVGRAAKNAKKKTAEVKTGKKAPSKATGAVKSRSKAKVNTKTVSRRRRAEKAVQGRKSSGKSRRGVR